MSEQSDQENTSGAYLIEGHIIRNPNQLNLRFYGSYDHQFLYRKAQTLMFLVKERERFTELVSQAEELSNEDTNTYLLSQDINDKYFEGLRAEVYFTEMHQFEGFFALLLAVFQPLPHWLYLTAYKTGEMKKAIQHYLSGNVSQLTNGYADNVRDFIVHAVYSGFTSGETDETSKWSQSLAVIDWLIKRMGEKYLKAADFNNGEYNAYKHGIRVLTGPSSLQIATNPQGPFSVVGASDNSLAFLEWEDVGEGGRTVFETTKHFNPDESFFHLYVMQLILEELKKTRLARINNEIPPSLRTFYDLDKEQIAASRVVTYWRFPV